MTEPLTWVVGAGGLLGSHVEAAVPGPVWRPMERLAWGAPTAAADLWSAAAAFLTAAGKRPWQVAWCAGSAVTHSSPDELAHDAGLLDALLDGLRRGARSGAAVFFASSAGGVYAGSEGGPFTELSAPRALAPYGLSKLEREQTLRRWSDQTGVPVVLGRIANLYGPGQDLGKTQGVISHLCRAHLLRQPMTMFVPLSTVRDYLYVEDAARLVVTTLERARLEGQGVHVKVLASQRGVTLASLLGELRRVFKTPMKVVHVSSPAARFQAADLRLRSVHWPELDRPPLTPLPVGIQRTHAAQLAALQAGRLR